MLLRSQASHSSDTSIHRCFLDTGFLLQGYVNMQVLLGYIVPITGIHNTPVTLDTGFILRKYMDTRLFLGYKLPVTGIII